MATRVKPQHRVTSNTPGAKRQRAARRGGYKFKKDGSFKKSKRGKYNAQGSHIDGHWFASKAEGIRYLQLKEMEKQGTIEGLELQPSYRIMVSGQMITTYRGDFRYVVIENGKRRRILEDVKGMQTTEYKIKKKLVEALFEPVFELPAKDVSAGHTAYAAADTYLALKNRAPSK